MAGAYPDVGDVHVNAPLTNIGIGYLNKLTDYAADRVFPLVGVDKQTDIYPVLDRGYGFADEGTGLLRAPLTEPVRIGYKITNTNTYFCPNFALAVAISDELKGNADPVFDLDRIGLELATHVLAIQRERAFAADFMVTGVWNTTTSVTNKWNDYGLSDPITDLRDAIARTKDAGGYNPNKTVMGEIVWRRIQDHPDFVERIKGAASPMNPAIVQKQLFAAVLGLEEVIVSEAVYRSSAEGATLTLARIIDDDLLLVYTPPGPAKWVPAAGYTFYWKPLTGGGIQYVRRYRDDKLRGDFIEVNTYYDQVATVTQSGELFLDVVD